MSGYKLIDFKKTPIKANEGTKVEGVFSAIMETKKETRLINLVIDGQEYSSITANFNRTAPLTAIVPFGMGASLITITTDDIVTIQMADGVAD